ncbi:flagellar hook-basal body complex protein [bacterium]|nr:flagellar hook-basal body complex protein [bacterium]
MLRSLYAGISGLRNFQVKMDVIGNNIANVNTIAFKGARATFGEALAQTMSGSQAPSETMGGRNPMQIGLGMQTMGIDSDFSQGSMESTGIMTDLAVQGNGFFVVTDGKDNYFTRAGTFTLDADGNMVTSGTGMRVKGHMANQNGELDSSVNREIQIPLGRRSQAKSTSEVTLYGNLDMNMNDATARLSDAGETGVDNVTGTAENGVGGVHTIVITGENAIQSSASSAINGMSNTDTLEGLGVTDVTGFSVLVDSDRTVNINGLTVNSTVAELIRAINSQVSGVTAKLEDDGSISITRDFYGSGANYNVQLNDGADGSDLVTNIFGGAVFDVNNGQDHTMQAIDTFREHGSTEDIDTLLDIEIDTQTGLANGLSGLGGGGVTINASSGLSEGAIEIETEDTKHSASIFVYDSLGNTHSLTVNFTKTLDGKVWQWSADIPEPATIISGGGGTVSFRDDGSLNSFTYDGDSNNILINPGNEAQELSISLNAGDTAELNGMTLTASSTNMNAVSQDGYGVGILQDINIDPNGNIFGYYSNGVNEILAQVLLANFTNPQGLERAGTNLFSSTLNSGSAQFTEADQIGSTINSGYLEMSNVDLSKEFTEMIITQRAFQANARVITTSDMLLQEVTALKR